MFSEFYAVMPNEQFSWLMYLWPASPNELKVVDKHLRTSHPVGQKISAAAEFFLRFLNMGNHRCKFEI